MPLSPLFKTENVVHIDIHGLGDDHICYTKESISHNCMSHQGFQNLEVFSANALVELAPSQSVLDIGFGLGYSAQSFIANNITSYTCIEINTTIYNSAIAWREQQPNRDIITIINGSWQEVMPVLESNLYGIIYYSMFDEVGDDVNLSNFMTECGRIITVGGVCSIQGITLFSNEDLRDYTVYPNGPTPPPEESYDTYFTVDLYNKLAAEDYFRCYYQTSNANKTWST
jgi:protein-L-isoaspartate O-methyltransferase